MSEQSLHLVARLRARLRATVRRMTLAELAFGALVTGGVFFAGWFVAAALEAGLWLAPTLRAVVFGVLVALTVGLALCYVAPPLLRLLGLLPAPPDQQVARRIGARYPDVSDRLVNLLDLAEGRATEAPSPLVDGAVQMLGAQVEPVRFEGVEDFGRARRAVRLASVPAVGVLAFLLVAPATFLSATDRLFSPGEAFDRPAPFAFEVAPGSVELVRGEALPIRVRTSGREAPRAVTLALQHAGEERVEEVVLLPDSTGGFSHTLVGVRQSLRYRVAAAPVESPWFEATVTERPLVRTLQVRLDFPAYTGIPPQRLEPNVGDVTALPGTRVRLEVGVGGRDVTEALLRFDDGTLDTLVLDGATAAGGFTLRQPGAYQILLRNTSQVENRDPISYTLGLVDDARPSVVLLDPAPRTDLTEALETFLRARITDDFGFRQLRLVYRLAESRYSEPWPQARSLELPLQNPRELDQEVARRWRLVEDTAFEPAPGDVIEYYVQVWDNDAVAGFKTARSEVQRLRLPSMAEMLDQLNEEQDDAGSELDDLLSEADQIREQFDELRDELRRKQEGDWEDQRQLESLQQRQQALEERVDRLSEQIEEIGNQMEQNDLVSEETLQQYRELQQVVEEINSPELQEALRELQEAMQNLDLQQLQESLGDFEFNEEQYRQRLERTKELFERLRLQQGLEEAARRAQDLAEQQERLAEQTEALRQEDQEAPEETPRPSDPDAEQDAERDKDPSADEPQAQTGDRDEGPTEGEDGERSERDEDAAGEPPQDGESPTAEERERLAREQERARAEMERLLEQLDKLRQQAAEMRRGPEEGLDEMMQQTQPQQLPQEMQQNSEQLRQNELQDAQQQQQNMQQRLQQMQQQLSQMQGQMQGQQMQVNMAGLRRALDDVLTLSQQQEALRQGVSTAAPDGPQLREYAQQQVELAEGLSTVSDSLQALSREIPEMSRLVQQYAGEALKEMGSSTESMADRAPSRAAGHQKASMMHLNELALLLSDLMNQMMNGQGGQGSMSMQQMMQQLQQMAGQQQQLNQQIQQLLNDVQGNRLTGDQQRRLQQMAEQQRQIRQQLKQMARNPAARGKLLGDLDKIGEQMEETIEQLQRGRVDRPLVERQQQILTRLLDAQKSLQQRGQERQREGRTGDDLDRTSPAELSPTEQAEKLRRDLLRALESGYAPDFEELIKRYFELLQQEQSGN